jgi:YteA family regulatory protein
MTLTQQQLSAFRSTLVELERTINRRQEDNDKFDLNQGHPHETTGELSSYDNHPGDEGTALYEREKDIALHQHLDYELENIQKALTAMDKGNYGECLVCGQEIPLERLDAIPTTLYCKEHSPDQTVSHNRPIEEGVLMPPFGKFFMDEKDEDTAFDAEDSWQAVAEWGTSESPSALMNPPDDYNDVYIDYEENVGYTEDFENFTGNDIEGKNVTVYPNKQHEQYEEVLDEEGTMTTFGDLPAYEHDPYVED